MKKKMKYNLTIGKPCHFRPNNNNVSACGIINPVYAAYDARDCDCLRCKKTLKYKIYLGEKRNSKENKWK
jgi:hypothetical protein